MSFVWDPDLGLFRHEDYQPVPYSDGPEVEQRLYEAVRNASDRTSLSAELAASITNWPSEYHLSRSRHCLLRPLAIRPGDTVLELGCGCGAITRYLGELGADVVAVEGSLLRARVAAERCREHPNVKIFVDDLLKFESDRKFDWVLLIGVLEYAPAFSNEPDPVQQYLESARSFLASTGRLVIAIENKVGLKYFNGCAEDHTGIPFYGIQDLYGPKTARTFGKRELTGHLATARLSNTYFYYPFPDYKLPSVVLTDAAFADADFDPVDLLARCRARDYSGSSYRSFDEALAFSVLHKNGLLAELSNSFLVVATVDFEPLADQKELAFAFSVDRAPQFCTQTTFRRCGAEISVLKDRIAFSSGQPEVISGNVGRSMTVTNRLVESRYRPSRQVLWAILRARARNGSLETAVEALCPWMEYLLRHARAAASQIPAEFVNSVSLSSYLLPGDFIDCIPFNLLHSGSDLVRIDMEWQSSGDIPLGWVVTRGILWSLSVGMPIDNPVQSVNDVIEALAERFGFSVEAADIQGWLELESKFLTFALGRRDESLAQPGTSNGMRPFIAEIDSLRRTIVQRDEQISSLSHGMSEKQDYVSRLLVDHEQRLADIRAGFQDAAKERDRLQGELSAQRMDHERQVADLAAGLRDAASEHERLQANLSAVNGAMSAVSLELSAAKVELANRSLLLADRSLLVDAILNSRSWRLTSLLRTIAGLNPLRRYRRRRQFQNDIELLSHSTLFDADWYLANNPDVARAGAAPIPHYLLHGAGEGRNPSASFSTLHYLQENPDIRKAGVNPLVHYLRHGAAEGRQLHPTAEETSVVVAVTEPHDVFGYMSASIDASALPRRVAIGVSSLGNFFMAEIAYMIEDAFLNLGVATRRFSESDASAVADYETVLIVAPHEFFLLGSGPMALEVLRRVPSLIMFNVEQRQTQWFRAAEKYLPYASIILDINYHTACHLARSGYRSFFLPLGYSDYIERTFDGRELPQHEIFKHMPASVRTCLPATYEERPIDILFIGASSERRKKFFSQNASYFATKPSFIYLPDTARPFLATESRTIDFAAFVSLVRRSKLLLNVHQDDDPFFEWQRIVTLGIMQRTLVISDHCEPVPCVEPNIDYLDGSLAALPGLCEFALHNLPETERIVDRAYARLRTEYPLEQILAKCWTALGKPVG